MLEQLLSDLISLINDKVILITGGTGSFGHFMTETLLKHYKPKKIIIFSRDEFKQYNMKQIFPQDVMRYFIGDIRDFERLKTATKGVDIIFHAAAMKQVDTVEYNPFEAIKTNIYGTENVVKAAIYNNVGRVIGISTDKCVSPINLYGATKLCVEKIILHANVMADKTLFCVVRYGNVLNSRGSVVPLFKKQSETGIFHVTDDRMTRFTLTIDQAITFTLNAVSMLIGGEIFIPKIPSYNILQLAKCMNADAEIKIVGKRPGEKIHESMISASESFRTIIKEDYFIIVPEIIAKYTSCYGSLFMQEDTEYTSGNNVIIDDDVLKKLIEN